MLLSSCCPVSYTHLDVYKRQALAHEMYYCARMFFTNYSLSYLHGEIVGTSLIPVSYTHLDVYKRQIEYTLIFNSTGLLNFSHDKFIMLGAYIFAAQFLMRMGTKPVSGVLATVLTMFIFGVLVATRCV